MTFNDDFTPNMPGPMISLAQAAAVDGPLLLAVARQSSTARATRRHRHARGQLLGATTGLLSVDAGSSRWVVPATHAVWIPPNVPHGLRSHGPFAGWSLYIAAPACAELPNEPCVLAVSGLMREAVARAASWTGNAVIGHSIIPLGVIKNSPPVFWRQSRWTIN